MEVALLNVRITFQKNEVVTDAIGNHKNRWTDYYSCHATVSGESGSEKVWQPIRCMNQTLLLQSVTVRCLRMLTAQNSVFYLMGNFMILHLLTI